MKKGLFIDRDGTLIEDSGYLHDPRKIVLLKGASEAMRRLARDYLLFLFTNQSGIGRGFYTWEEAGKVNRRLETLLGPEVAFTAVCMAPEPPDAHPVYRKPSPRFILECIRDFGLTPSQCWMVGDRLSDVRAGLRAGIRTGLVTPPAALTEILSDFVRKHHIPCFADMPDLAQSLLKPAPA